MNYYEILADIPFMKLVEGEITKLPKEVGDFLVKQGFAKENEVSHKNMKVK
jgi:hypothetical protein